MHTERGFDRLVNFSDAVVAIAITLLILPLVDSVTDVVEGASVWDVVGADLGKFMVFIISFAVIGRFWIAHHRVYERAVDYDSWLLWANLFWLFTIVFLPYPTELLSESSGTDDGRAMIYVGTMLASSLALLWQQVILKRRPQLVAPEARGTLTIVPSAVTAGMMLVTFLAVAFIPGLGLWGLFLLVLTTPLQLLARRVTGYSDAPARPRSETRPPPS
ncbi:TMEM175 family protein [Herbiconiux sp. CPCC 205716]|uniref:TMEM175 family protein n=1 Tax=Herbiconiux gentiana TaxID=2970912 RepID=A0ABT2GLJ9_9MICO|nr:TMEM175 family protein [Herbiconiux gentiana]MCS5715636.1 TMEM175 family protein [Herbiconiux gentiana]